MKILLTGGTGFIGSNLIPFLQSAGHELVALTRCRRILSLKSSDLDEWVEADLAALEWDPISTLPSKIDVIIHLAQSKHYQDFPEHGADIYGVNTAATFKLLDYGQKVGASHFIYASSGSLYNGITKPALSEDEPINPSNFSSDPLGFYCASKLAGEILVEGFRNCYKSTASLRIFAPYGKGGDAALVNRLANRVKNGGHINIQGNPGLTMNPIHVDDVTRFITLLLKEQNHIGSLNIAGQENVSLTNIVKMAGELCGETPDISYHAANSQGDLIADIKKMKGFSLEPDISLEEGIQGIIES